ncbi:MAG: hypothetical protein ACK4NC_04905 [Candidatus Gracilibacteria bacterium]
MNFNNADGDKEDFLKSKNILTNENLNSSNQPIDLTIETLSKLSDIELSKFYSNNMIVDLFKHNNALENDTMKGIDSTYVLEEDIKLLIENAYHIFLYNTESLVRTSLPIIKLHIQNNESRDLIFSELEMLYYNLSTSLSNVYSLFTTLKNRGVIKTEASVGEMNGYDDKIREHLKLIKNNVTFIGEGYLPGLWKKLPSEIEKEISEKDHATVTELKNPKNLRIDSIWGLEKNFPNPSKKIFEKVLSFREISNEQKQELVLQLIKQKENDTLISENDKDLVYSTIEKIINTHEILPSEVDINIRQSDDEYFIFYLHTGESPDELYVLQKNGIFEKNDSFDNQKGQHGRSSWSESWTHKGEYFSMSGDTSHGNKPNPNYAKIKPLSKFTLKN